MTQLITPGRLAEMVADALGATVLGRPGADRGQAPRRFTHAPLRTATGLDPAHQLPDALPEIIASLSRATQHDGRGR